MAVITGDFNRAGIAAVAIFTIKIRMFVLLHYRMASVASGLLPVGFVAFCAGLHISMQRAAVCQFKVFIFMAGLAGVEGQASCEFYCVVRTYARFFRNVRVNMAAKAEAILKLLFPMPCMAVYTAWYLKSCAVAFLTALVHVGAVGYVEDSGGIGRCYFLLCMRPVALRTVCNSGNHWMAEIQDVTSGAVNSQGRECSVKFQSSGPGKNS